MKFRHVFLIMPVICLVVAACGGSAIGDAQQFEPNEPPVILSIKAVNFDGSEISQLDIEPYKQFKLIVEAVDPDNNPLEYKFDSESGTFAGITANSTGCTAIFKTGRVVGGQNVEFWAGVSDGRGALVRQSYNLGTGKSGPTLVAILEKIRFRPGDKVKLSVTANCSGFFQFYSNGNNETEFKFENDMFRYSYSENKTTELILGGPKCASFADIQLEPRVDGIYGNDPNYNIVLVFRDGLFQTSRFIQEICVDGTGPNVLKFPPDKTSAVDFNTDIVVTFDEEIGYADSSCLELTPSDGEIKLLRISRDKAYFYVTGLTALTDYTAVVKRVKDIAGNEMDDSVAYSFKTISGDLQIKDKDGKTEFTTCRGFEESSVNLNATFKGKSFDIGQVDLSVESASNGVSVDSAGKVTINPHDLTNEDTVTVKIKAVSEASGAVAYYTVTINSWYPVTAASEFGNDGVIGKNLNGKFKLDNNIDFENGEITPIGSYTSSSNNNPFTGIFDGGNKTLSNFTIKASSDYAGLFAYNKGTIRNVVLNSASFNITGIKDYLGIIAGYNEGIIEKCKVENSSVKETNEFEYPDCYVGGIAGKNKKINDDFPGLITGCSVNSINITAGNSCGGLIGFNNEGTIEKCSSSGSVTGSGSTSEAGGLVGSSLGGKITGCSSSCDVIYVTSSTNSDAGGLIGYVNNSVITDCFSTGTVSAGNVNNVGGLIGYLDSSTVKNSYHDTGSVSGKSYVGGLIGYVSGENISNAVKVTDCHVRLKNDSVIDVKGSAYVGGLIGNVKCTDKSDAVTISLCSAIGNIEATDNYACAGGLIGQFEGNTDRSGNNISQCFSEGKVKADRSGGGLIGIINYCHIINCYSKSEVYGTEATNRNIGGLVGFSENSKIENCYAVGIVPTTSRCGGLLGYNTHTLSTTIISSFQRDDRGNDAQRYADYLPYTDLQTITTYTSASPAWDIAFCNQSNPPTSIWLIDAGINDGYPHLNYNPPQ
ncbi:MAG: Ig-like domain-containing protein [Spirochaetes bacterium]|nr:Ig-like domain-containing protein [Spirochaetota bacterium]